MEPISEYFRERPDALFRDVDVDNLVRWYFDGPCYRATGHNALYEGEWAWSLFNGTARSEYYLVLGSRWKVVDNEGFLSQTRNSAAFEFQMERGFLKCLSLNIGLCEGSLWNGYQFSVF